MIKSNALATLPHLAAALAAAFVFSVPAQAQDLQRAAIKGEVTASSLTTSGTSNASNTAFQQVLAADELRYQAMYAGNIDALANMLADELLYTHSSAITDTKETYLASLRKGTVIYHRTRRDNVQLHQRGNVVVMAGHVVIEATVDGTPRVLDNRFLTTWVKDGGQWKLLSWASTAIPKT